MSKIAIVYWSGTGNTERMAQCIAEGVMATGGENTVINAEDFNAARLSDFDAFAFGCPAMGAEVLEEDIFDPMFTGLEASLSGKKIALFGSYGWGDGEWMQEWCTRAKAAGAILLDDAGLILNELPDDSGEEACRELGRKLAAW